MFVIDCAENYSSRAAFVKSCGAVGVIRYFNPLTNGHDSGKSLTPLEAHAWADAQMPVGIVVEGYGMANGTGVDGPSGGRDARLVLNWLPSVGLKPNPNLIVYFAVDADASADQINQNEVAYFDAIRARFNMQPAAERPRIGIYGSAWSCMSMVGSKRADEAWVAGSTGWAHYRDYVATNAWRLLQKIYPGEKWNGLNADTDTVSGTLLDAGLMIPFAPLVANHLRPMPVPAARPLPGPTVPKPTSWISQFAEAFRKL